MDDRIESGGLMMEKYREWWKEKRAGKRAVDRGWRIEQDREQ